MIAAYQSVKIADGTPDNMRSRRPYEWKSLLMSLLQHEVDPLRLKPANHYPSGPGTEAGISVAPDMPPEAARCPAFCQSVEESVTWWSRRCNGIMRLRNEAACGDVGVETQISGAVRHPEELPNRTDPVPSDSCPFTGDRVSLVPVMKQV